MSRQFTWWRRFSNVRLNKREMSKLNQIKIPVDILKEQGIETEFDWKLVRERDGLTKQSKEVMWVEWNEDSTFKSKHDEPVIGRSLIMSPFNQFFTWQTTTITEIVEKREDYVKFKTGNSTYELFNTKEK
ncbi:MAG: hypothetical protein HKN86_02415 [Acidimicrobiia bacterium]|nr:hypothetical protein [Acidimicrobiia bacterium]